LPDRFAKACPREGMRVQIPRLPLPSQLSDKARSASEGQVVPSLALRALFVCPSPKRERGTVSLACASRFDWMAGQESCVTP